VAVLVCVAVGGGLFVLGRESGKSDDGHAAGVREGRAAGVAEGRALQMGESAPSGTRQAFEAGYAAGANDVFGGFDGGWSLHTPYVITVRKGSGAIAYRIDSRRPARGTSTP
jgi:hypothetical protein